LADASIRVLIGEPEGHVRGVAQHVRSLQKLGYSVLYVTTDRPFQTLAADFRELGVDSDVIFFLDSISYVNGQQPPQRPVNAMFLQSPTMLEMMAMRTEQLLGRVGERPFVVLDSLSALAVYNGIPPVQEFSHYLANRLRTNGVSGDFVIKDNQTGRDLVDKVSGFCDSHLRMSDEK